MRGAIKKLIWEKGGNMVEWRLDRLTDATTELGEQGGTKKRVNS